jgi:hypothetical protein
MKHAIRVLVTILAICPAFGSEIPPELERLNEQRASKIAEIDKVYMSQLESLKIKFTKAGNLDAANQVVALINATAAAGNATTTTGGDNQKKSPPANSLEVLLKSKIWTYKSGDSACHWTFLDGQRITSDGWSKPSKWETKNNSQLIIHYGDGNTCTFDFKDFSNKEVLGKTNKGSARYLAPWKDNK